MNTIQLLDLICARYGCSDYRAAKLLSVSKQTVSHWRTGKGGMNEAAAIKAAQLLDRDPAEVLILLQAERTKDPDARKILHKAARALHRTAAAAVVIALPLLGGVLLPAGNTPAGSTGAASTSVYYVKWLWDRLVRALIPAAA